jgi:hypothetical protein
MAGESIRQTPSPTAGIWCPLLSASAVAAIARGPGRAGRMRGLVGVGDKKRRRQSAVQFSQKPSLNKEDSVGLRWVNWWSLREHMNFVQICKVNDNYQIKRFLPSH